MDEGGTRARGRGVTRKIAAGPPARLTKEQLEQLPSLLALGAETHGFAGEVWTTERVALLIHKQFGVSYHSAHISRLLKAIKYSVQQPIERATQRDEQAIKTWKDERWPTLKKAQQEGRIIIFVDETGLYLLPMRVRTYAPVGQTPVLRVPSAVKLGAAGGAQPR